MTSFTLMKRYTRPTFSLLLIAFLLVGLSACADEASEGDDTNQDVGTAANGMNDDMDNSMDNGMNENSNAMQNVSYTDWDANGDGELTKDEFYGGVWDNWDANGDGQVNESEFNDGTNWLFGDAYGFGWSDWDPDNDGQLSESEFNQGWNQYDDGFFDDNDADANGWLSEDEFNDASFNNQNNM